MFLRIKSPLEEYGRKGPFRTLQILIELCTKVVLYKITFWLDCFVKYAVF